MHCRRAALRTDDTQNNRTRAGYNSHRDNS